MAGGISKKDAYKKKYNHIRSLKVIKYIEEKYKLKYDNITYKGIYVYFQLNEKVVLKAYYTHNIFSNGEVFFSLVVV